MIVGLGLDVASIARMKAALERHGERFADRILTAQELAQIAERADRAQAIAGRFAAKEAAFKALGVTGGGIGWHDIRVLRETWGPPRIEWDGAAAARIAELGVQRTFLSITHDAGVAAAVVILERST